jgi:uncharacterized membrane protein YiaA
MTAFVIGLWRSTMAFHEKWFYFTVLMFGLFAAVSVQKAVRDRSDGIPVSNAYFGICWIAVLLSLSLMVVGLWNTELTVAELGFYGMSFLLSLFAAITVQKNVRDLTPAGAHQPQIADARERTPSASPAG